MDNLQPTTYDSQSTSTSKTTPFRIRWHWGFTPFVAIGCALLANIVLITQGKHLSLDSISSDPYGESAFFDQQRAARNLFDSLNLTIHVERVNLDAQCRISSTQPINISSAQIAWYRADDATLDHVISWDDISQPLRVPLPKSGWWWFTFTAHADGKQIRQRQRFQF